MEIVISVPESWEKCNNTFLRNCIRNGKVLPKGHGALKDVSKIHLDKFVNRKNYSLYPLHSEDFKCGYNCAIDDVWNVLCEAPTIIETEEDEWLKGLEAWKETMTNEQAAEEKEANARN